MYETADGRIAISMTPIDKLVKAFHNPALENYSIKDQMEKREEINEIVSEEMMKKKIGEWFVIFDRVGIWCAPVNGYEEVEKDAQVQWNKMIMDIKHPDAGDIRLLSHPTHYDGEVPTVQQFSPRLGEHTK